MIMPKKTPKRKATKPDDIFSKHKDIGVRLDLGCGGNKAPGFIGVDFRAEPGVDVVQDLTRYPWDKLPDECASLIRTSHLLEHINPDAPDPRLAGLIDLLRAKKVLRSDEITKYVGDYRFLGGFVRFMDECWRVLKPGGQAMHVFPYAATPGYWQDPTHVNPITEVTIAYFDPLAKSPWGQLYHLYTIYRPLPWKVLGFTVSSDGFCEIALEKRIIDPSYKVSKNSTFTN